MKKTVFALVAVSALGLAACGGGNKSTNTSNSSGTVGNEAIADVNSAETATNSALDANANAMANSVATNSVENASNTVTTNSAGNSAEKAAH
jgi:hypothetical protein